MANPRLDRSVHVAENHSPPRELLRVDQAIILQSDLSVDREITAEELDAIARILGDDLEAILSEA